MRLGWTAIAVFGSLLASSAHASDPNALWKIVNGQCVPHQQELGSPLPCVSVNTSAGYAILKDVVGKTQLLLIPTAKVTGIEDFEILAPNAPDYWENAWEATRDVEALAGKLLPREDLSLAINSPFARTQNQLHIHIDCVRAAVAEALRTHANEISDTWTPFAPGIGRTPYRIMRVPTLQQPGANPFQLLAHAQPEMSRETLAVVGATLPGGLPGFYLLETRADPAIPFSGGAEELQDHDCKIAHLPMQN
jgi:CDP-diacylglycerol pyrophosphatase